MVPRPAVHIFMEDLDQPYVGYINCRDFYPGTDAATALTRLGQLPSALLANRLLLAWEQADLLTALGVPANLSDCALITVEATFAGHVQITRPFATDVKGLTATGLASIRPAWTPESREADNVLPKPIEDAITWWRRLDGGDFNDAFAQLVNEGYNVNFISQ